MSVSGSQFERAAAWRMSLALRNLTEQSKAFDPELDVPDLLSAARMLGECFDPERGAVRLSKLQTLRLANRINLFGDRARDYGLKESQRMLMHHVSAFIERHAGQPADQGSPEPDCFEEPARRVGFCMEGSRIYRIEGGVLQEADAWARAYGRAALEQGVGLAFNQALQTILKPVEEALSAGALADYPSLQSAAEIPSRLQWVKGLLAYEGLGKWSPDGGGEYVWAAYLLERTASVLTWMRMALSFAPDVLASCAERAIRLDVATSESLVALGAVAEGLPRLKPSYYALRFEEGLAAATPFERQVAALSVGVSAVCFETFGECMDYAVEVGSVLERARKERVVGVPGKVGLAVFVPPALAAVVSEPVEKPLRPLELSAMERDALLAALEHLGADLRAGDVMPGVGVVGQLLTAGGQHGGLTATGVARLYERVLDHFPLPAPGVSDGDCAP